MGKGYIYKCPKCKRKRTLRVGVGFTYANPIEIEEDIRSGLYGERAKAFLDEYAEHWIDAYLEIYQCRCGNIENKYHITMKASNIKKITIRQHCAKCGSVMKMLNLAPEEISCKSCGHSMKIDAEERICWD